MRALNPSLAYAHSCHWAQDDTKKKSIKGPTDIISEGLAQKDAAVEHEYARSDWRAHLVDEFLGVLVAPLFGNRLRSFRAFRTYGFGIAIATSFFDIPPFDDGPIAPLDRNARQGDGDCRTLVNNDPVLGERHD